MGDGELAALRRDTLGFIFQQFNLIPTLTAQQNVEAALAPRKLQDAPSGGGGRPRCSSASGWRRAPRTCPSQLSGGEQQRVAIARALANGPRVLLADEPTGNLDTATGEDIVALLTRLSADEGLSVVLITHDPSIADAAGRVVRMRDGRVLEAVAAG